MTMPPFYIVAQLKYTGTEFTKQTSSLHKEPNVAVKVRERASRRAVKQTVDKVEAEARAQKGAER